MMAETQQPDGRRQAILTAAERCFQRSGYAQTTMDQIAESASVAKGSIYNYFTNKQDLFDTLVEQALESTEADYEHMLRSCRTAREKLERMLDNWFARLEAFIPLGQLVMESWATAARDEREGRLSTRFLHMYRRWRDRLAGVIAEGAANGEFSIEFQPHVGASLIMAVMDGIEVQAIFDVSLNVDQEFISALKKAVFSALTTRHLPQAEPKP